MKAPVQADRPPVGLIDVNAFPMPSTATHSDTDAHDTPAEWGGYKSSSLTNAQAPAPRVGLVEVITFPRAVDRDAQRY